MTAYHARRRLVAAGALTIAFLLVSAGIAAAHDMFVKPVKFIVGANSDVLVRVLNGTFSKSENSIARTRLADVSVVSPAGRQSLDTAEWSVAGDTSTFHVRTSEPGTYVLGVSTRPSIIALSADTFNMYLAEDGIPDALTARRRTGELGRPAKERYSKHVKSLIQVGNRRTEHYATALGYPAEIVPQMNPYSLRGGAGVELRVRTVVEGTAKANQFVLYGGRTLNGSRIAQRSTRSDTAGIARIPLRTRGYWYVKFINMTRLQNDSVDYESRWATLTFEVR